MNPLLYAVFEKRNTVKIELTLTSKAFKNSE